MTGLTAVVTCHAREWNLRHALGGLQYQTRKPDQTLVFVSGVTRGAFAKTAEDFPWAEFFLEDDKQDWGHHKRAAGLERATKDFVGFFNDDDSYNTAYIETMLSMADRYEADVVYCAWNEFPSCDFKAESSTSGNFIVRTELARQVGYPASNVYANDGVFIDGVAGEANRVVYVPQILYHHNRQ